MFKRIANTIKKGFSKVGKFFVGIGTIMTTPFRKLTWPKRIIKVLGIGLGIYIAIGIVLTVIVIIATAYFVGSVIFSFGGAIENGTNEVLGRNRRRRDYY